MTREFYGTRNTAGGGKGGTDWGSGADTLTLLRVRRVTGGSCFGTSPSNECSGLIPFRMDWFNLTAVQGTLKSFLQHRSSKASILRCSAFISWSNSHIYTRLLEKPSLQWCRSLLTKWCLCFLICYLDLSYFPSKEQVSFNFMAAVTIHGDSGVQENTICHFYFFSLYVP